MDESIVKYFERPTELRPAGEVQQKVGRIKLSVAIRIGARIRPQCTKLFWTAGGSCAFGAALEAVGYEYGRQQPDWGRAINNNFPNTLGEVGAEIVRRNDSGESRESIADWLESQGL